MSDYAKTYVTAKLQAAAANINTRIQEISSQTGIEFGSFLSDAMEDQGGEVKKVDGLALAQSMGLGTDGGLSNAGLAEKIEEMKKQFLKTDTAAAGNAAKPEAGQASEADFSKYDELIEDVSSRYGLSPVLIKAVIKAESGFNPGSVSRSGAMGLMQLMPATADGLGVTDAFDPKQNIDGGVRYLLAQLQRFDGDVKMSLAAYNCGPSGVTGRGITDLSDPAQMSLLPAETRTYIANIERYLAGQGAEGLMSERVEFG